MTEIRPGDIGFSTIGGAIGWLINLGQALIGDASRYTHVFIVLDDGTVMEMMPSGAKIAPLVKYKGKALISNLPLTDTQRVMVVDAARKLRGTKYGFSGYLFFILSLFDIKPKWLIKYLTSNGRMICSQSGDYVLFRAGWHVFDDGRPQFSVSPGDLFYGVAEYGFKTYK